MILIEEIYQDVVLDDTNKDQNGTISFARFNRYSWRAQLEMIDWLTGNTKDEVAPRPPANQKNKDFLAPFLKKHITQVVGGVIDRPEDYYTYNNAYKLNGKLESDCDNEDEEETTSQCNTPIEILSNDKFYQRCNTHIDELKPSFKKPISKLLGKQFEFAPSDLGSIAIEYYRYPLRATIVSKMDTVYNEEVIDAAASTNFEWDESARPLLIWFIVDQFANHTREKALKEFNAASNPKQ